jgi:hypothetical protein
MGELGLGKAREVLLDDWMDVDEISVRRFSDYWLRQMRLVIMILDFWQQVEV